MWRWFLIILLLMLSTSISLAQDVTGEMIDLIYRTARASNPELGAADNWSYVILAPTNDTSLGCNLVQGEPLPSSVIPVRVEMNFGGQTYIVRISLDGQLVQLCDAKFANLSPDVNTASPQPPAPSNNNAGVAIADGCPEDLTGYMRPRLRIGEQARVKENNRVQNNVRFEPSPGAFLVGQIPQGSVIQRVNDGPVCNDGHVWWNVTFGDITGWTVESTTSLNLYYLLPIRDNNNAANTNNNNTNSTTNASSQSSQPAAPQIPANQPASMPFAPLRGGIIRQVQQLTPWDFRDMIDFAWHPTQPDQFMAATSQGAFAGVFPATFTPLDLGTNTVPLSHMIYNFDGNLTVFGYCCGEGSQLVLRNNNGNLTPFGSEFGSVRNLLPHPAESKVVSIHWEENQGNAQVLIWSLDNTTEPVAEFQFQVPVVAAVFDSASNYLVLLTSAGFLYEVDLLTYEQTEVDKFAMDIPLLVSHPSVPETVIVQDEGNIDLLNILDASTQSTLVEASNVPYPLDQLVLANNLVISVESLNDQPIIVHMLPVNRVLNRGNMDSLVNFPAVVHKIVLNSNQTALTVIHGEQRAVALFGIVVEPSG